VLILGGTVLLVGLLLIVLPGPAFVVIPVGLAILATEFAWARRLLARAKGAGRTLGRRLGGGPPARWQRRRVGRTFDGGDHGS
jgi:tellurite resistance protein TerC